MENKILIILGDLNIDLLKSDIIQSHSDFLDIIESYLLTPQILLPTRITETSKKLIDNILVSASKYSYSSGNIIYNISDHLPQFTIIKTPVDLNSRVIGNNLIKKTFF